MSAAAAARAKLGPDEDSTVFFGDQADDLTPDFLADAVSRRDDLTALAELDSLKDLDSPTDFRPIDELGESGPALLAARAEPLDRRPPMGGRSASGSRPGNSAKSVERTRSKPKKSSGRRKPKEPSKLLIALGVLVVGLAGVGVAYFLSQRGSDDIATSTDSQAATGELTGSEQDGAPSETSVPGEELVMEDEAAGPSADLAPVVIFDDAAIGPVEAGIPHQIAVGDGPADSLYQLLVDDIPAADPAPELPPVIFEPGRHLLVIEITSGAGLISTDPVVVYALGEIPGVGYRANLSSVNIMEEGWAEAVRQFDEYVAAGHDNLRLMPSAPFPSLVTGYWNLFVDGFDSATGATDYCEGSGLSVPEQCFAQRFDPNAPAIG